MSYIGDFRLGDTLDTKFTTTAAATGAPTTLAGTPVISAYVGNSVTQITAGITLTVDFDGVTGLHNVRVVASGANGYATASNYQLVITTGTVGGTSAVGYVVAEFSIEARSAVMPTTAARTLDVSATGEAGVDWANVGSPTTSLALTGTTIATTQKVDIETIKTNPVVNAGTVTFPTTATLASTTNITAGTITTVTNLTNAPTAGDLTATMKTSVTTAATAATPTAAAVTGAVGSVTGAVGSVTGAVGSVTGNVGGNVTGSVGSLAAQAKADVNAEVVDALATDTYAEPGQGTPAATATLATKISFLYKAWRNRHTQTASEYALYGDDAVTKDQEAVVSDDATTFERGEVSTGA